MTWEASGTPLQGCQGVLFKRAVIYNGRPTMRKPHVGQLLEVTSHKWR